MKKVFLPNPYLKQPLHTEAVFVVSGGISH
jgi:hypothetical protein